MDKSRAGEVTAWGWGRSVHSRRGDELEAWRTFNWIVFTAIMMGASLSLTFAINAKILSLPYTHVLLWLVLLPVTALVIITPVFAIYAYVRSAQMQPISRARDVEKLFTFANTKVKRWFGPSCSNTVAIGSLHDAYMAGKLNVEGDMLDTLYQRHKFANFRLTWEHMKFFCLHLIPEFINHSRSQDRAQVTEHYDRGNDFYNGFLGDIMIYTCAFFKDPEETLEAAQIHKMDLVCRKLHLKPGEKHLDLGCGWGTLVCHAAKNFGSKSLGITIAKEQVKWGKQLSEEQGLNDLTKDSYANFVCCDYRDTPREVYDKISCLEMSEHVGIRNYETFLHQVYDMLDDDGLFYLQIAGLRRSWQYEDLVWGLFMGKYVFPGADASAPISLVVSQLERCGFEVHSVENVGIHYSATIKRWYDNWQDNKDKILQSYGQRWWRQWNWFLAWSVIAAEQGSSTCYQIICNKNTSSFNRKIYVGEQQKLKY